MTRDDILRLAREVWGLIYISESDVSKLEKFAALAAASEREACAKLCEERMKYWQRDDIRRQENEQCAAAIRARGEKP